jgi:hypothetical protein
MNKKQNLKLLDLLWIIYTVRCTQLFVLTLGYGNLNFKCNIYLSIKLSLLHSIMGTPVFKWASKHFYKCSVGSYFNWHKMVTQLYIWTCPVTSDLVIRDWHVTSDAVVTIFIIQWKVVRLAKHCKWETFA